MNTAGLGVRRNVEQPYVAHMRVIRVAGDEVEFDVKTQPRTP